MKRQIKASPAAFVRRADLITTKQSRGDSSVRLGNDSKAWKFDNIDQHWYVRVNRGNARGAK